MRLRVSIIIGMVVAVAGGTLFIASRTQAPAPARIALVMPLSIDVGQEILNAVELAVGHTEMQTRVELVPYDTISDGIDNVDVLNIQYTREIVEDPSIVAVIGASASTHARDTIPILNRASVLMVSPLATAPELTKPGYRAGAPGIYYPTGLRSFFRTISSDEMQAAVAVDWIVSRDIGEVFVIFVENDTYSEGLGGLFIADAPENDIDIVGTFAFEQEDFTDNPNFIDEVISAVEEANPEAVYFPLVSQRGNERIIEALRAALPNVIVMGGDGLTYETLQSDDNLFDGIYATTMPVDPTELDAAADFVAAYEAAYDEIPPGYAMTAYDATLAVLQAIKQTEGPITPENVLLSMRQVGEIDGAQGIWSFTPQGDINKNVIRIVEFDGNDWQTIDVVR